jgi:hypothetical protein
MKVLWIRAWKGSAINVASMSNINHRDAEDGVIDFVDDPIVSGSDAPRSIAALELLATGRTRVVTQRHNSLFDRFVGRIRDFGETLLSPRKDDYAVTHLRSCSISSNACWRGIGTSPEALASSYARISSSSSSSSRILAYSSMVITTAILSPFSFVRNCVGFVMAMLSTILLRWTPKVESTRTPCCKGLTYCENTTRILSDGYSSSDVEVTFRTAKNASCGMSTWPTRFMRFLPSFCFSRSLRLREMSPP